MSYASQNGYTPATIEELMDAVRVGVNAQFGTSYSAETWVGTNWYKYFYALIQKVQENEVKTSEIFQKLQEYITLTNQRIQRPSVSAPGILDSFASHDYIASVKPPLEADAGKISICVDVPEAILGVRALGLVTITSYANLVSGTVDEFDIGVTRFTAQSGAATPGTLFFRAATNNTATALSLATQINAHADASLVVVAKAVGATVELKAVNPGAAGNAIALVYYDNDSNVGATVSGATLEDGANGDGTYADVKEEICGLIKDFVAAGIVSQGNQIETIVLSNGQSFDFKFNLPDLTPILVRATLVESENNILAVPTDVVIRQKIFDNINSRYRLGWNFEPQRYYGLSDAPWAQSVLVEYSLNDGGSWSALVYDALYTDLFTLGLEDIEVVIS